MQIKALGDTSAFGQQVLHKANICIKYFCITAIAIAVSLEAAAVGLGDLAHHSLLGEPLNAQIEIINVPPRLDLSQLKVRQIQGSEAISLGVDLVSGWMPVNTKLERLPDRYQIALSTRHPIKEPLVNVLIELSWPSGTIFREYNVLLNPPGFLQTVEETVTSGAIDAQKVPSPNKANNSLNRSKASIAKIISGPNNYTVKPGDTLDAIATEIARLSQKGLSPYDISRWLVSSNPEAFIDGDGNRLIAGAALKLPEDLDNLTLPRPLPEALPQKQPSGRLRLESTAEVTAGGNKEVEARLAANEDLMEVLRKENDDLRARLDQIENSEYLGVLQSLVDEQRSEINSLHKQLRDAILGNTAPPVNSNESQAPITKVSEASTGFNLIPQSIAGLSKGSFVMWAALGVGVLSVFLATLTGFAYWRNRSRSTTAAAKTADANSDRYEFSALWHTEHVSNSTTQKYYEVSEEFPEPDIKQSIETQTHISSAPNQDHSQQKNQHSGEPTENSRGKLEQNKVEQKKENLKANERPPASNDTIVDNDIEIDEDLENYLKL